jgi:hypothetical protein
MVDEKPAEKPAAVSISDQDESGRQEGYTHKAVMTPPGPQR